MEKIAQYQQIIKAILSDYITSMQFNLDEEIYLMDDPIQMNYLIYHNKAAAAMVVFYTSGLKTKKYM